MIFTEKRRLKPRKSHANRRKLKRLIRTSSATLVQDSLRGWLNHARYANTVGLRKAILAECRLLAEEVGRA